jgi:hypothetical protein
MEALLHCNDQEGLLEYLSEIEPGFKGTRTDRLCLPVSALPRPSASFDSIGAA